MEAQLALVTDRGKYQLVTTGELLRLTQLTLPRRDRTSSGSQPEDVRGHPEDAAKPERTGSGLLLPRCPLGQAQRLSWNEVQLTRPRDQAQRKVLEDGPVPETTPVTELKVWRW